jgi:TrpR-related protein YerC/YecD
LLDSQIPRFLASVENALLYDFIVLKLCCKKYTESGDGNMSKNIRTSAVDHLFEAILSLKDSEECYTFFEDICTVNELLSLSQRYEVARMLRNHKTYLEIAEKTGASTATISRVNRSLNYGNDGYDMVFSRTPESSDKKEE